MHLKLLQLFVILGVLSFTGCSKGKVESKSAGGSAVNLSSLETPADHPGSSTDQKISTPADNLANAAMNYLEETPNSSDTTTGTDPLAEAAKVFVTAPNTISEGGLLRVPCDQIAEAAQQASQEQGAAGGSTAGYIAGTVIFGALTIGFAGAAYRIYALHRAEANEQSALEDLGKTNQEFLELVKKVNALEEAFNKLNQTPYDLGKWNQAVSEYRDAYEKLHGSLPTAPKENFTETEMYEFKIESLNDRWDPMKTKFDAKYAEFQAKITAAFSRLPKTTEGKPNPLVEKLQTAKTSFDSMTEAYRNYRKQTSVDQRKTYKEKFDNAYKSYQEATGKPTKTIDSLDDFKFMDIYDDIVKHFEEELLKIRPKKATKTTPATPKNYKTKVTDHLKSHGALYGAIGSAVGGIIMGVLLSQQGAGLTDESSGGHPETLPDTPAVRFITAAAQAGLEACSKKSSSGGTPATTTTETN